MKTQRVDVPRVVTGEQPRAAPKHDAAAPPGTPRVANERSDFDRGRNLAGDPRLSAPDLRAQSRAPAAAAPAVVTPGRPDAPPNGVARLSEVLPGAGLVNGQITVNGRTYDFRSGKPANGDDPGRLPVPVGEFRVADLGRTQEPFMTVDGEGWRFQIDDPKRRDDSFKDPRHNPNPAKDIVQGTRKNLRIHPDGDVPGTDGCIGIVGGKETQQQFRADLLAELKRNPNFRLRVEGPAN